MVFRRNVKNCARILQRNPRRNIPALERLSQANKTTFKFLFMFDILKKQDHHVIQARRLSKYKPRICLLPHHSMTHFLRRSPKMFDFYEDQRRVLWCALTPPAERFIQEKENLIAQTSDKAAEYVTRMLMMSVDKMLPLDKILLFRRDFGLPEDIMSTWVHSYPELFKVVQPFSPRDEGEYLQLVSWRPEWAITELEKRQRGITEEYDCKDYVPGLLRLAFPMKFPRTFSPIFRDNRNIHRFQLCEYLSPYAEPKGLIPGTHRFNKRAVAIMHELLSFSIEKKLVIRQLGIFRSEFVLPQKVFRLLLKYLGIFYVSQKGVVYNVYLNEAYQGGQLIEKHPLVIWKENFQKLVGFGKKRGGIMTYEALQDEEDEEFFRSVSKGDKGMGETEGDRNYTSKLEEEALVADDSEVTYEALQDEEDEDFIRSESKDDKGMVETEGDRNCTSMLEEEALVADDSEVEIDEIYIEYKTRS